jgi:hypothetical protein
MDSTQFVQKKRNALSNRNASSSAKLSEENDGGYQRMYSGIETACSLSVKDVLIDSHESSLRSRISYPQNLSLD